MDKETKTTYSLPVYYRLIALWVLGEAMLGGIIHGLRIPISGLVVGSCAVVCICLIAWYVPGRGAILKATLVVAIFKMILSPQAPLPAYIAVFFQGLMGELLFYNKRFFKVSCLALSVLALLESGLQRIIVLTVIYGNDLWNAINVFFSNLAGQDKGTDYSYFIIIAYIIIHFTAGLLVGFLAGILPQRIKTLDGVYNDYTIAADDGPGITRQQTSRRKKRVRILLVIWLVLVLLYFQSYFAIGKPLLPTHISLRLLIRSVIVVLAWLLVVGPLSKWILERWLRKKQTKLKREVQQVAQLLPASHRLIIRAWQLAGQKKGWKRMMLCLRIILANTFHTVHD